MKSDPKVTQGKEDRIAHLGSEGTAVFLLALNGFEEGLEVAFAKAFGPFALDDFKKHRGAVHHGFGEE